MREVIDILEFRKSVVLYQKNKLQAKLADESIVAGESMAFVKNNRRQKIVLSTAHKAPEIKCEELFRKASIAIREDTSYSDLVEFYYPFPISESTAKKITEMAYNEGLGLIIYDYAKLSKQKEFANIFKQEFELESITPAYRVLYDMLLEGSNVSEIKNSIVYSMLIFAIYDAENHEIKEEALERQLQKIFHNLSINQAITYLISEKRITSPQKGVYALTDKETADIEKNIENARRREADFINQFGEILSKYNIAKEKCERLIIKLTEVYKENFKTNIQNPITAFDKKINTTFNNFKEVIKEDILDENSLEEAITDIRKLCTENTFLNRISASESFISLYDSPELLTYLDKKSKHIYLDTPVLVYYICSQMGIVREQQTDWDNNLYIATKHLLEINRKIGSKIGFYTIEHYIKEAAGELRKALRIDAYRKYGILYNVSDTGNTFYNYFCFLRENKYIDSKMTLAGLLNLCGFKNINPEEENFVKDSSTIIKRLLKNHHIIYQNPELSPLYADAMNMYEEVLRDLKKNRTPFAKKSDVNLVLHLTSSNIGESTDDYYICSWDPSFIGLGKWVVKQNPQKYNMFSSYNPSKLANKLAFERFDINSACITDGIFAYADENYELSTKVRNLYDNDLSKITAQENSLIFIDKLEELKDKYLYQGEDDFDNEQRREGISLDSILDYLTEKVIEKHTKEEFELFYKTDKGKEEIYNGVNEALKAQSSGKNFYPCIDNLIDNFSRFIIQEGGRYQPYL